jgi:hypothetical protein
MNKTEGHPGFRALGVAAVTLFLLLAAVPAQAGVARTGDGIATDISITLHPARARLEGEAVYRFPAPLPPEVVFRLSAAAVVTAVLLDDRPVAYRFSSGRLAIAALGDDAGSGGPRRLTIRYTAVFDDPAPELPLNTDNPGYGVTGTIVPHGAFLLGGAGWYPLLNGRVSLPVLLTVSCPKGMLAITAGRRIAHVTAGDRTRSIWEITQPVGPLSLSAGYYAVGERQAGQVAVYTYFLNDSAHLSDTYLTAAHRFIEQYTKWFGPYPFSKFAVVENFFPTGYGFPSYTLLGTRVLHLPFIPYTSLAHEIAHCWWGNGVFVDGRLGNWSEGLTTYVADYMSKEMRGDAAARAYRRQWLRNYATLVDPESDFPLSQFRSRTDPVTKVIGYDKSAMAFHMLRKQVGEDNFWTGLRRLFAEMKFQRASWVDIQRIFSQQSGQPLEGFFHQWVQRRGAPSFALRDVTARPTDAGFLVEGALLQLDSPYELTMTLAVTTAGETVRLPVTVRGAETPFQVTTSAAPLKVTLDPGVDVFRRLARTELPPTVNTLKASDDLLVVAAGQWATMAPRVVRPLLISLGLTNAAWAAEADLSQAALRGKDLLFLGLPAQTHLISALTETMALGPNGFSLGERVFDRPEDALFTTFQHPFTEGNVAVLFHPLSPEAAMQAVRKITHYGKYSTLVFTDGKNRLKQTWPVTASPTVHHFSPANDKKNGES